MRVAFLITFLVLTQAVVASGQQFQLTPNETKFVNVEPSQYSSGRLGFQYWPREL